MVIGGVLAIPVFSSERDSTLQQLPTLVITGKASPKIATSNATVTIDSTEIERSLADHTGEILNHTAGFTVRDGYQEPLLLRGLPGRSMLVLRDGIRRFSSYPAGYMTHTTNVYELEQIEIRKGASPVQYGAGAIAGTINLIDRDPLKGSCGLSGKTDIGCNSNNEQKVVLGTLQLTGKRAGIRTSIRARDASDYTNPNKSKVENSSFSDKDITINAAVNPINSTRFDFRADMHRGGPWEKPRGFTGTNYMLASTPVENSTNLSLSFKRNGHSALQLITGSLFYSDEYRQLKREYYAAANMMKTYEETTSFKDSYYGMQFDAIAKLNQRIKIHSGIEGYHFLISAPSQHYDYVANLSYQNRNTINARSTTGSLYSELIVKMADGIGVTAGGRYDACVLYEGDVYNQDQNKERNSIINAGSGAVGIKMGRGSVLGKINLSRSYRVPQTNELFTDSYTSRGLLLANPDLQPEYCYGLDAVLLIPGKYISFEIDPFLWLFDDMISRIEVRGMPGTVYRYTNIGRARLWGGEVQCTMTKNSLFWNKDKMKFSLSGAVVSGRDVSGGKKYFEKGEPLDFIPPPNARSELMYQTAFGKSITVDAGVNFIGYLDCRNVPQGSYKSPGYVTLETTGGVKLHYGIFTIRMQFAVTNLLNTTYYSFQSYLPAPGRDFRFMTSIKVR